MLRTFLLLFCCSPLCFAEIYQVIDKQGNLLYTDRPSAQAKRVELPREALRSVAKNSEEKNGLMGTSELLREAIEKLEEKLEHVALNDYEEAVLKVKLAQLRQQLLEMTESVQMQESTISNPLTQSMLQMNIRHLRAEISKASAQGESTFYLEERLQKEQKKLESL